MPAALLASSTGDIGNSTPRINNKSELLRWCTDPETRGIIPKPTKSPHIQRLETRDQRQVYIK